MAITKSNCHSAILYNLIGFTKHFFKTISLSNIKFCLEKGFQLKLKHLNTSFTQTNSNLLNFEHVRLF